MPLGAVLADLIDLVLPTRCVACGADGPGLCPSCVPAGPLLWTEASPGCRVAAAGAYGDALRTALIAHKERGHRELTTPLAALLADAIAGWQAEISRRRDAAGREDVRVAVVAVPSSSAARGQRGGDPLMRLAARAARRQRLRLVPDVLWVARAVLDSAGLGRAARQTNLDHAFAASPPPPRTAALLVDDIITTGATLREAERALVTAGWPVLGAAVVAATPAPPRRRQT